MFSLYVFIIYIIQTKISIEKFFSAQMLLLVFLYFIINPLILFLITVYHFRIIVILNNPYRNCQFLNLHFQHIKNLKIIKVIYLIIFEL